MNKNINQEKLENGFSLYINGPETTKKTKTGLWPTPTKTLFYQFSSNICTPFKNNKNLIENKQPRRFWHIDKNPSENGVLLDGCDECKTANSEQDELFGKIDPKNSQTKSSEKLKVPSQLEELISASPACKDIFHRILALEKSEKKLILDALCEHMQKDCNLGDPLLKRELICAKNEICLRNSDLNFINNGLRPCNPFLSAREPTFSGKNKPNANFCDETKTFWEEFNNSSAISAKYKIVDSTTDETSDIFDSVELHSSDMGSLQTIQPFRFEFCFTILTNWGGNAVGFNRIEVTAKSGESIVLNDFRLILKDESKANVEYSVSQNSILVPCFSSNSAVQLFSIAQLSSPADKIRIWNYWDVENSECGIKLMSIFSNSKLIFTGEIPQSACPDNILLPPPFIICCKN